MFIREIKRIYDSWVGDREYTYYYLVESYRDETGKSRQRKLLYLGKEKPTLEEAIKMYESQKKEI